MKYFELNISVKLKRNLSLDDMYLELSNVINSLMKHHDFLGFIHKEHNYFKFYSYTGFAPVTKEIKEKDYKKDSTCYFKLRTPIPELSQAFSFVLMNFDNDLFDVTNIQMFRRDYSSNKKIRELYTITPTISTITEENKIWYWTADKYPIELIIERMNKNLIRKYNKCYGENIPLNHIAVKSAKLHNGEYGIKLKYKKFANERHKYFYGNKFQVYINEDPISQKLAWFATSVGLLEKNSLGYGFCELRV